VTDPVRITIGRSGKLYLRAGDFAVTVAGCDVQMGDRSAGVVVDGEQLIKTLCRLTGYYPPNPSVAQAQERIRQLGGLLRDRQSAKADWRASEPADLRLLHGRQVKAKDVRAFDVVADDLGDHLIVASEEDDLNPGGWMLEGAENDPGTPGFPWVLRLSPDAAVTVRLPRSG